MVINQVSPVSTVQLLVGLVLLLDLTSLPAKALPNSADGASSGHAPQLLEVSTTQRTPNVPSTYHFTIQIPEKALSPIEAIVITQRSGMEQLSFIPAQTHAFARDNQGNVTSLPLVSLGGEQNADFEEITIKFDQPVPPGEIVTVALPVQHNPQSGGIYQFGVTAFADVANSVPFYLGTARLHFVGHN